MDPLTQGPQATATIPYQTYQQQRSTVFRQDQPATWQQIFYTGSPILLMVAFPAHRAWTNTATQGSIC